MKLTHLSLFSGIGGIDLAAEWAGFETVCFVEKDVYCQKVLRMHWPDVPILEDIFDVTKETVTNSASLRGRGIHRFRREQERVGLESNSGIRGSQPNSRTADFPITLITGGFPCQPVSTAGKQRGKEDDRWLWPEMLRVITEIRPRWVVAENVAGLIRMGLDDCISDLENSSYAVEPYLIPACAVNAPHRRDRIFIVAHANGDGEPTQSINDREGQGQLGIVADSDSLIRKQGRNNPTEKQSRHGKGVSGTRPKNDWWAVEPDVGRVAHGVPSRVDRLRALGNAVVPQQIYPILKAIAEIERNESTN